MNDSGVLWTADQVATATAGNKVGRDHWQARGVSIDSRSVVAGDLFVALCGPRFDGNRFIAQALAAGAVAAVAEYRPPDVAEDAPLVVVDNGARALVQLAETARRRSAASIIGVTGSVGKTGVKEGLKTVLAALGTVSGTTGNLNNQWGLPLSLARLPEAASFGVFEMGMDHAGEIAHLTAMARPHVAVITSIAQVHAEFFVDEVAIAAAKAEIFAGVEPGGAAVLPCDSVHYPALAEAARQHGVARIIGFGGDAQALARWRDFTLHADGVHVEAEVAGQAIAYQVGIPGRHWVDNSLAVLAAVHAVGGDVTKAAAALAQVTPLTGRGQRHHLAWGSGTLTLIDDSYNASPTSLKAALATLGALTPSGHGRRIAVLGDMLELGTAAPELHAGLADAVVAAGVDLVFSAGPLMAHLQQALPPARRGAHVTTSDALLPLLRAHLGTNDVVLVKGSLGSRMGLVVTSLRQDQPVATATRVGANPEKVSP